MTSLSTSSQPAVAFAFHGEAGAASPAAAATAVAGTTAERPVRVRKAQSAGQPAAARAAKSNSDHRKEQNRIASRNYRAKRKQKLALLEHILADNSPSETDGPCSADDSPPAEAAVDTSPQAAAPAADQLPIWPQQLADPDAAVAAAGLADPGPLDPSSFAMPAMMPWITPMSVPPLSFQPGAPPPPAAAAMSAPSAAYSPSMSSSMDGSGLFSDLLLRPASPTIFTSPLRPAAPAPYAPATSTVPSASARPVRHSKALVHRLLSGVRKLEPAQKRLLLRALLAEENGSSAGGRRVQEVDVDDSGLDGEEADDDAAGLDLPWETQARHRDSRRPLAPISPLSTVTVLLRRSAFRAAVLHNCLACGLPDPATLFADDVDPATGVSEADELQSPFALDAATACAAVAQGPAHVAACVAAARRLLHQRQARSGRTTPRDLVPVDAQILVAHHPYLDVIPFRGFRARALALLAAMEGQAAASLAAVTGVFGRSAPPAAAPALSPSAAAAAASIAAAASSLAPLTALFNEDELCYDMDVADGLVCWGSANGSSTGGLSAHARRSERPGGMRACVPWDVRGWEPQVWFLKKYWFLVGGWDDEMWRGCRWWHSMRGEHLDYSVFTSPGY